MSSAVFPIDIVITWVDTTDELWKKRYETTLNKPFRRSQRWSPDNAPPDTELSLCLKLIRLNVPWVRKIFIVTQQQDPKCRTENEIIIDHSSMGLGPVFNSLAIESALHRIPGLSEHFLYYNDDFFTVKTLTRDLFFTNTGNTIAHLETIKYTKDKIFRETNEHTLRMYNSKNLNLVPKHTPQALTITQMTSAEARFPKEWVNSRNAHVRGEKGEINVILATCVHTIQNGTGTNDDLDTLKCIYSAHTVDIRLIGHWFNINPPHIICINSFNSRKQDLYDSIEKRTGLFIKLVVRFLILFVIIIAVYKYCKCKHVRAPAKRKMVASR